VRDDLELDGQENLLNVLITVVAYCLQITCKLNNLNQLFILLMI
jgi:hypothetical protein